MARLINCTKNGIDYFRVTTSIGRDSNGKLIRKEFYGDSKKNAEAKRDEYLLAINNGLNVGYKNILLGVLMRSWLFEVVKIKVKPTSFEKYEGIYRNYIKESQLYTIKLADLKSIQIQRHYNNLCDNGKSSNAVKSLNKLLKTFFNYAVDEGYMIKNPCLGNKIVVPGLSEKKDIEIQVFTKDEISILRKALENHRLKCLILMALGTGLRQGELLALQWSDIDMDTMEVNVTKTTKRVKLIEADGSSRHEIITQKPKTKTSNRTVPIPSSLIPMLKKHLSLQKEEKLKAGGSYTDNKLIFATATGNPLCTKNLFNSYKCLLQKAGIEHKKFHALRYPNLYKIQTFLLKCLILHVWE